MGILPIADSFVCEGRFLTFLRKPSAHGLRQLQQAGEAVGCTERSRQRQALPRLLRDCPTDGGGAVARGGYVSYPPCVKN